MSMCLKILYGCLFNLRNHNHAHNVKGYHISPSLVMAFSFDPQNCPFQPKNHAHHPNIICTLETE